MGFRFELSVALKYLIPRKKQLSVSLIALLSVGVISLVVWLVLVFLSVTEGIERSWLQKLTTLNAPLRITPTEQYYASYYYQIDGLSSASQYAFKNIAEKKASPSSDPFNPLEDTELPTHFPQPDLGQDPVKDLFAILEGLKRIRTDLSFQDFELSGALMRLQLLRQGNEVRNEETQGYITQVSYLASFPDKCPKLPSLLIPPTEKDLNHLLYLASHSIEYSRQDAPQLTLKTSRNLEQNRIQGLLEHAKIGQLKPKFSLWQIPLALLPPDKKFEAKVHLRNGKLSRIDLPVGGSQAIFLKNRVVPQSLKNLDLDQLGYKIWKEGSDLFLENASGDKEKIPQSTPILIDGPITLNVEETLAAGQQFRVQATLQGATLKGTVGLEGLEVYKADFKPPWVSVGTEGIHLPVNEEKESGVLLAKSFQDSGVMIGDRGYLSYSSATLSSLQEHRLPIFVAGFYDPGILSVGNKCILVPSFITRSINASSSSFNLDKLQSNGVLVWFEDLNAATEIKNQILLALNEKGLDSYWKVTTFREYDFAKDLAEQFQSDKYLFALVGIIILIVACCNIISMLVLLVNDKKREIGILQAMGASRLSIAAIFGICGMVMGILSSMVGTAAALFTMRHIDSIVQLLSFFQGHDAFNIAFFGKSLPHELSVSAVTFILIATPTISLLAGLLPAIKACRLKPAEILRAE